MLLDLRDAALFFKLHSTLMCFVNQRLQVLPDPVATPEAYAGLARLSGSRCGTRSQPTPT